MNIQLDIDGVLADFTRGFAVYAENCLGITTPERLSDRTTDIYKSTERAFGDKHDKIWDALKTDPHFWESLPALAAWPTFSRLNRLQREHDVYFTTHRMGVYAKRQTVNWLRDHGVSDPTVLLVKDKGLAALGLRSDWSIEDKWDNALDIAMASPRTKSYLVNRPHNQTTAPVGVRRVNTVLQFIDLIEEAA